MLLLIVLTRLLYPRMYHHYSLSLLPSYNQVICLEIRRRQVAPCAGRRLVHGRCLFQWEVLCSLSHETHYLDRSYYLGGLPGCTCRSRSSHHGHAPSRVGWESLLVEIYAYETENRRVRKNSARVLAHRLDVENGLWVLVKNLDGRVFFVGDGSSSSVSADHFPLLKPGAIYFHDHSYIRHDVPEMEPEPEQDDSSDSEDDTNVYQPVKHPGHLACICHHTDSTMTIGLSEFGREYEKIFWPPPGWL